jgi:ubiquinone/menaquinone biosynthesis C-methylase UbiE
MVMEPGHGGILHSPMLTAGGRREISREAQMTARDTPMAGSPADADRRLKAAHRAMWALGDYHSFAASTVWELGPVLVDACRITRGQRVLDVAAGTGNVAIRAAMTGATVVASDLTPENFDSGRRAARAAGAEVEWVEGDAERLPFEDEQFDVVTSCFGAMFAPDQQKVAGELARVCRAGGTIGMINFTAESRGGEFFGLLAPYAPPPQPGAPSPLMWGNEEHVRTLFGERVASLELSRREYVERAESARAYLELFKRTFGPMVAIYASLTPDRAAALDRDFLEFVRRANRGGQDDAVQIPYEYLLVVGRKTTQP